MSNKIEIINLVTKVVQRQQKIKLGFGLAFVFLSGVLFTLFAYKMSVILGILILTLFIGGLALIYNHVRYFKSNSFPLLHTLRYEPKEVVWVYHQITQVMPFGIFLFERYNLFIFTVHGESYQLIGKKEEILSLLRDMPILIPSASYGHTIEREQLFVANPVLLIQED